MLRRPFSQNRVPNVAKRQRDLYDFGVAAVYQLLLPIFLLSILDSTVSAQTGSKVFSSAISLKLRLESWRKETFFRQIHGTMEVPQELFGKSEEICFYLPFNDPQFDWPQLADRRLAFNESKLQRKIYAEGNIEILAVEGGERLESSFEIVKVKIVNRSHPIKFEFKSLKPLYDRTNSDVLVFESFHPQLLENCSASQDKRKFQTRKDLSYETLVSAPKDLRVLVPQMLDSEKNSSRPSFPTHGESYFVALNSSYAFFDKVEGFAADFFYNSEELRGLGSTIQLILNEHKKIFSKDFPFHTHILETRLLERSDLPGFVFVNRAQQSGFRKLEVDWLNWMHWSLTHLFSRQWFGALIRPSSVPERWLLEGTADYLTLRVLKKNSVHYNLFKKSKEGREKYSFTYIDFQNLSAAILSRTEPFSRLTTDSFKPVARLSEASPYLPVKQAIALRYLSGFLGEWSVDLLLRETVKKFEKKPMSAVEFLNLAESLLEVNFESITVSSLVSQFWREPGWPDFRLSKYRFLETKEGWDVEVKIDQLSTFDLPVPLTILGADGKRADFFAASPRSSSTEETFQVDFKPSEVILDESRFVFDLNRYNNSSSWPAIRFFPGNANELDDDGYNILWFAYPFRRSGDSWQLAVQAAILRYISSNSLLELDFELEGQHRLSGSFSNSWSFPRYGLETYFLLGQGIEGKRLVETRLQRSPLFSSGPLVSVGLLARHRETRGDVTTRHQTYGFNLNVEPRDVQRMCRYQIKSEYESAPKETSPRFQYEKRTMLVGPACRFAKGFDLQLKGFLAQLDDRGVLPKDLQFNPQDQTGAGIRLDRSGLQLTRSLYSIRSDFFIPFGFRVPRSSYLLPEQLKWRIFYDFGRDTESGISYAAAGGGLFLPFGGDVSGIGTLSITQFSLLWVGYSRIDDDVSREPRLLFGLNSEI